MLQPSTIVCPLTTNFKKRSQYFKSEYEGGLQKTSLVMIDRIQSIDNMRFIKKIRILS